MSEQPSPVRAWAEYDEIALFWHEDDAQTWLTPKGEWWCPSRFDDVPWIVATMEQLQLLKHGPGPLRSLRVLLSTGHELWCDVAGSNFTHWWLCRDHGSFVAWDYGRGSDAHYLTTGLIDAANLSDSAAVERALADAIAWVAAAPDQEGR